VRPTLKYRFANTLAAGYFVFSVAILGVLYWNWQRSGAFADMANWIISMYCVATALAVAVIVVASLLVFPSRISHFLTMTAMIAAWLGFAVSFNQPRPRIDFSVRIVNASTKTITVDTFATFGQPVTASNFWTLRPGQAREWGCLCAEHAPTTVSVTWWVGNSRGREDKMHVTAPLQVPSGLRSLDTLQLTVDEDDCWTVTIRPPG
jgi:hypothetical protein